MQALVVILALSAPFAAPRVAPGSTTPSARDDLQRDESLDERTERERCIGSGAAGAVGGLLGLALGGGLALGAGEIVKAADPANTSASKSFTNVAIPTLAIAGGLAGLAVGTLGSWELTNDLAGKPPVTR